MSEVKHYSSEEISMYHAVGKIDQDESFVRSSTYLTHLNQLTHALALSEAKLKKAVEQRDGITSSYLHPYVKEIKYQIYADNAELAAITLETGG